MKKGWKITLISLGSLLGLVIIIVAVALWLVFTPKQLTKIVNSLADKYVNAETHFENVDLTLLSTFPDAGLKVDGVYIINPVSGAPSDTLARIGSLTVGLDVKAFLKENKVIVHQVLLDDADANLYIARDGSTNFDIFPSSGETDTTSSPFSLDSLPGMDLRKIKIDNLNANLLNEQGGMKAGIDGLDLDLVGTLKNGLVDANLSLDGKRVAVDMTDSTGAPSLAALLENMSMALKGNGNLDAVDGHLKLKVGHGTLNAAGTDMVNEHLQASKNDLITLEVPFSADLKRMLVSIDDEARLKLDDYAMSLSGTVQLPADSTPMEIHAGLATDGAWQVEPLLKIVPAQFTEALKGMDVDAKVSLQATADGTLTDTTMPLVDAKLQLADGRFYMPSALPYKINRINGDLTARLDLGRGGVSHAVINSLTARTRNTDLSLKGRADDLTGDMRVKADIKGNTCLDDLRPMLPDTLPLSGEAKAKLNLHADFAMSQLQNMALDKVKANGTLNLSGVDVTFDSIHAVAPSLDIALQLPAKTHKGRMADATITGGRLKVDMPANGLNATMEKPDISVGVNNPLKNQLAADFEISAGETEATMDSMLASLGNLVLKGSLALDSTQKNIIKQYNPNAAIEINNAVVYAPGLPDAIRLSEFDFRYRNDVVDIRKAEVKIGHSDFALDGTVEHLERWLDHEAMLVGDLNFTSSYADIDQLMNMFSGLGSDADTIAQMREEDNVPAEANPFIVPKDVNVTLHTHIKRSVAFGNDLSDVAGALTVNDGVAILDQMGFVCKAATMQLTALYKSPRPNNLFVALDFHLLDIEIDELLDMIPAVDTLVPMLAAFDGNANFHLAAETFLDARYQPKMSSLLGSAAITGKDLVLMDDANIAQIAKLMKFKSWKEKDNKIHIDSLDVELSCFRKEIEVFPFLISMGKYQICVSGKHNLDNLCNYHFELLKNPLLAKVGVDVKGPLSSPKISLGEVRYSDLFKPEKQGVVEKRVREQKEMIKKALEANVR